MVSRSKRTYSQRIADLQVIGDLYCKGKSQYAIGQQLGLSQQQISYDLKEIHARWLKTAVKTFNAWIAGELAKIDHLEREAWLAWERSCVERHESTAEGRPNDDGGIDANKLQRKTVERDGDPRFLDQVKWCIERRAKLLGLDKPEKHSFTDVTGEKNLPASVSLIQVLDVKAMSTAELDVVESVLQRQLQAHQVSQTAQGVDARVASVVVKSEPDGK